jgi:GDP-L-fucose synthase
MDKNSKIYVAGHRGLAGSAIFRQLENDGYKNLIVRTHSELDLTDFKKVEEFFSKEKPEYVFLAAAKVGGIGDNNAHPAIFIRENLMIQTNVIDNAHKYGVKKLLFLGSSCIYPKFADQPIKESSLLSGELESTSKAYAIAKIAGIVMCQSYTKEYGMNTISVMPSNLYGPNDNFNLETSHVLPALIRKFDDAKNNGEKEVILWGTGSPKREFLYSDDLARACIFLMNSYNSPDILNIGTGEDISIFDLAQIIKKCVGYSGQIVWNKSHPDGTPKKLMDVSKINSLGWKHKVDLEDGIIFTYEWYKSNKHTKK